MKSEYYIAGIILITLICLLFFFQSKNRRKKNKHLMDEISKLAKQNTNQISKFDLCGNMIIGMDDRSGHILFFKTEKTENISIIITYLI